MDPKRKHEYEIRYRDIDGVTILKVPDWISVPRLKQVIKDKYLIEDIVDWDEDEKWIVYSDDKTDILKSIMEIELNKHLL